jgi:hypothetical protein
MLTKYWAVVTVDPIVSMRMKTKILQSRDKTSDSRNTRFPLEVPGAS